MSGSIFIFELKIFKILSIDVHFFQNFHIKKIFFTIYSVICDEYRFKISI